jgi:hypothetical protein
VPKAAVTEELLDMQSPVLVATAPCHAHSACAKWHVSESRVTRTSTRDRNSESALIWRMSEVCVARSNRNWGGRAGNRAQRVVRGTSVVCTGYECTE